MTTTNVLDQPTLVLNRSWQPVHVTTVARSLILLWNDAARVVDPEDIKPSPGATGPSASPPRECHAFGRRG